MDARHFASLFESVTQMDEIVHVERPPPRAFCIDAIGVTAIRKATGLSQAQFATLIDIRVGTLRNGEQGRREPTGSAKALLRAIGKDPRNVLQALSCLMVRGAWWRLGSITDERSGTSGQAHPASGKST